MDLDVVAWLTSAQGADVLTRATAYDDDAHDRAAAGHGGAVDPVRAASDLRRAHPGVDPGLLAAALTQVRVRRRARPRLGPDAARLLFTEGGLEQATRTVVAGLRAQRYAAAGATHVADLGCGLGLDSVAFARAGLAVTGVERDPVVVALARHNLRALGLEGKVVEADVVALHDLADERTPGRLEGVDAAFVDPARRDTSRQRAGRTARITDPEAWSPPWSWVESLAARIPLTAAKVAPGIDHDVIPAGGCATWTSVDGQLVEAEVAWPALASAGTRRRAVVVRGGGVLAVTSELDLDDEIPPAVGDLGAWVLEPDDAVIRAGLVGAVVDRVEGRLLDPRVAYVTTDRGVDPGPIATRFRVRSALPYDLGALRRVLVEAEIGHVVVKKRATSLDVDDVRRRLALPKGPSSGVVLLTRIGVDPWAIVCADPARSTPAV